jgi:hypothetical protein
MQIALQTSLAVLQHRQSSTYLSVVKIAKHATLADCDTDKSIDAASKLVYLLYDQKGKLKEDHVDLNKLRVRFVMACAAGKMLHKKNRIEDAADRMYGNENAHPWCL